MSGTPVEIHWFPKHNDRFLTWGSEINLYQVKHSDDIDHRVSTSTFQFCSLFSILKIFQRKMHFILFIYLLML